MLGPRCSGSNIVPGEPGHVVGWQEECLVYLDALVSSGKRTECTYAEGADSNQDRLLLKGRIVESEAGVLQNEM